MSPHPPKTHPWLPSAIRIKSIFFVYLSVLLPHLSPLISALQPCFLLQHGTMFISMVGFSLCLKHAIPSSLYGCLFSSLRSLLKCPSIKGGFSHFSNKQHVMITHCPTLAISTVLVTWLFITIILFVYIVSLFICGLINFLYFIFTSY